MVFAIQANNPCLLIVNGPRWLWTISALLWLWILLFLFFGNRGRLILLGLTVLVFLAYPHVDRVPIAAGEARAVMHIRRLSQSVDSYRREHPMEGFPANLPTISKGEDTGPTEKAYEIVKSFTSHRVRILVDRSIGL